MRVAIALTDRLSPRHRDYPTRFTPPFRRFRTQKPSRAQHFSRHTVCLRELADRPSSHKTQQASDHKGIWLVPLSRAFMANQF
jgi:hypothetical protein